jgi:hypothetical protein
MRSSDGSTRKKSRPVSRVLSWTAIHLGHTSPYVSSDLPGSRAGRTSGRTQCPPIWSCSGWGLPCRLALPPARCALTAPFHPYPGRTGAVYFLWHFPWARAPQALPGTLPCGARTFLHPLRGQRLSGRLHRNYSVTREFPLAGRAEGRPRGFHSPGSVVSGRARAICNWSSPWNRERHRRPWPAPTERTRRYCPWCHPSAMHHDHRPRAERRCRCGPRRHPQSVR